MFFKKRQSRKELLSRIEYLEKELNGRRDDIRRLNDRRHEDYIKITETEEACELMYSAYNLLLEKYSELAKIWEAKNAV
jgi:hypothetical protein